MAKRVKAQNDERLIQKMRDILSLAQRGATAGERAAAKEALARLMEKHGITARELAGLDDQPVIFRLDYKNKFEKELLFQVISTVLGAKSFTYWVNDPYKPARRASSRSIWLEANRVQQAEILTLYESYRRDLRAGLQRYLEAFYHANWIFPDERSTVKPSASGLTGAEMAEIRSMFSIADQIQPTVVRPLLKQ